MKEQEEPRGESSGAQLLTEAAMPSETGTIDAPRRGSESRNSHAENDDPARTDIMVAVPIAIVRTASARLVDARICGELTSLLRVAHTAISVCTSHVHTEGGGRQSKRSASLLKKARGGAAGALGL